MQKRSVVAAITGVAMFATAAFAAVSYSPASGGFIGRGDVIDHPDLGKAALVTTPDIDFVVNWLGAQECQFAAGRRTVTRDARTTARVSYDVVYGTRTAKSGTINGYVLSAGAAVSAPTDPTDLCAAAGGTAIDGADLNWTQAGSSIKFTGGGKSGDFSL